MTYFFNQKMTHRICLKKGWELWNYILRNFEPSHFVFQLNGICLACSIYINYYNPLECECVLCVSYFIWEYKIIHTAGKVQIMQEKSKLNEMCTACIAYFGRANIHPTPQKWPNQRKVAHVVLNVLEMKQVCVNSIGWTGKFSQNQVAVTIVSFSLFLDSSFSQR